MKSLFSLPTHAREVLVGMAATIVIALLLLTYTILEPSRIAGAQQAQLSTDLDVAMTLYAANCAICHGAEGEGIAANPPLATEGLRTADFDMLTKTIARGRTDTAMAAWSVEDGGPLGDYVVEQMVTLIQVGDWQATASRVEELGLTPRIPFAAAPDAAVLTALAEMPEGQQLAAGLTLYAEHCVACHGVAGEGTGLAPALNTAEIVGQEAAALARIIVNGVPGTIMAPWDGVLATSEIDALVTFLHRWDQVPPGAIPAPKISVPMTAESLELGASLFSSYCAACHGPDGQGTPRAPALNVSGFLSDTSDAAMQQIITMGVPNTAMMPWGDRMTEDEILALVGFIRFWEPTAPDVAVPALGRPAGVGGPPWLRNAGSQGAGVPALPSGGIQTAGTTSEFAAASGDVAATEVDAGSTPLDDWRVWILVGGTLGLAVGMVAGGVSKLHI